MVEDERKFQEKWIYSYIIGPRRTDVDRTCKHVIFSAQGTNHKSHGKFRGEVHKGNVKPFQQDLTAQQSVFTNLGESTEDVTLASCVVTQ